MRIRNILVAASTAALTLGTVSVVATTLAARQNSRLGAAQDQVHIAAREVAGLQALTSDYLLHRSESTAQQWHLRHSALAQALAQQDNTDLPDDAEANIAGMRETSSRLPILFHQFEIASASKVVVEGQREMLADHLMAEMQRIAEGVYQLSADIDDVYRASERLLRALVIVMPLLLLLMVVAVAMIVARRVLHPMRKLQAAADSVRAGDLDIRLDASDNDEFAMLARGFNEMTQALQNRTLAMQDRTRKLRVLTENLPALIAYVDRDERYRFCSAEYERAFGIAPRKLLGSRLGELLKRDEYSVLSPYISEALQGNRVRFEFRMTARGRKLDLLVNFVPERSADGLVAGFYMLALDISERRDAERQLNEILDWQRAILNSAPYAVITTDVSGVIQTLNPAAERMLWYKQEELAGRDTPACFHDPVEIVQRAAELAAEGYAHLRGFEVVVARARRGVIDEREWTCRRKDGSHLPVSLSVTAIRHADGQITGFLGMAADITERKRAADYIRHLAHHDVLTQLPNRALLHDRLDMAMRRTLRSELRVAVMMLDLDHFKRINDSLGHHIGDRLLQTVAQRLQASVRPSDTVARMGGDEFVVLLDGINGSADIDRIAQMILRRMAEPVIEEPHELLVTTSLGVAIFPDDGEDVASLLKHADVAMYEAKKAGRNAYRLFHAEMLDKNTDRLIMESALRRAAEREELTLHYQPQIDLASGEIMAVEALLRWNSADFGMVPPCEFIPLAEETGLILPIGRWVVETACRDAMHLQRNCGREVGIAVNLSPLQFTQTDLVDTVTTALRHSGLPPHLLELEITEGLFLLDSARTVETLHALREMGVAVSIDDFGTGYSSLSYLTSYPVDRIKIDQSFVRKLPDNPNAAAVSTAIVSIAHSLGMTVVAEGVETTEQFAYLKERGCDLGQGYLFSRPVPIAELIAWVESITSEAALLSLSNRSVYKYHATSTYPEEGH